MCHYLQHDSFLIIPINYFSFTSTVLASVCTFRSSPPDPVAFEFCNELLGDGVGSLQAGQLAVDSLTVDSLRLRLTDLEHRLRDVTTELREKQNLLNQHETEVVNIKKNSLQDSNIASRWVCHCGDNKKSQVRELALDYICTVYSFLLVYSVFFLSSLSQFTLTLGGSNAYILVTHSYISSADVQSTKVDKGFQNTKAHNSFLCIRSWIVKQD